MRSFSKALVGGIAALVVAGACTTVSNVPTIPPINLPSIPPINLPGTSGGDNGGGNLGGLLPSGLNLPGLLPSGLNLPPGLIPSGSVPCSLVTAGEVGQALGQTVTDTSDSATNCSFVLQNFTGLSVEASTDTDLSAVQLIMTNPQQTTLGGSPAVVGTIFGQPAVYIQKPDGQLQVLGVLMGTDPTTLQQLEAIATLAASRMP